MTEVSHGTSQNPNTIPKIQHSVDLGLERPFLNEAGEPAFGTDPINEDHLGDPAGIFAKLTPEQQQEALRTAGIVFGIPATESRQATTEPPATEPQGPETTDKEPFWTRRKKVFTAVGTAAAVLATGLVVGLARTFGNNSVSATPEPSPSASAPSNPGSTPSERSPAPSPSATESVQVPYDEDIVRVLEKDTPEEFRKESQDRKIQYYFKTAKNQSSHFELDGPGIMQEIEHNGRKAYEYLPWGAAGLNSQSDPQDVMYAYVVNQNVIYEQEDEATALKMMYSLNASPSEAFKADVIERHGQPNQKVNINNSVYRVDTWDSYREDGRNILRIKCPKITYTFAFYPMEGLSEVDANPTNDDEETGIWVLRSLAVR